MRWIDVLISLDCEIVIDMRLSISCSVALLLCASVSVRAQSADSGLSVQDGDRVASIARVTDGKWISEVKCVPGSSGTLKVSGEIRQAVLRGVKPGSPEWLRLMPTITELFERRESEQRLSDRTSVAPRAIDWIFVTEDGDRRMYYFEASRRVANASADVDHDTDPPGTVRIAVAGFLHDTKGRLISLGTKSELRWEQDGLPAGPSRPDLAPVGVVSYRGRSIWVMRGQSGTSGWFTLYDVSAEGTRTLLTARGPGC